MSKVDKMLFAYQEKFNDAFPVMAVCMDDDEICEVIQKCIDTDTPFDPEYDPDLVY